MLGKLLKQEFGATARYFIPLYGLILILTPLFALTFRMMSNMDMDIESAGLSVIASLAALGIFGYAFLIIAIFIATLISNLRSIPYLYTSGEDISDRTFQNTGSHSLGNPCRDHSHLFCYRYVLYQWICYLSRDDGWITFLI